MATKQLVEELGGLKDLLEQRTKAFEKHHGRPGKVGGSLPKGQGSTLVKNPPSPKADIGISDDAWDKELNKFENQLRQGINNKHVKQPWREDPFVLDAKRKLVVGRDFNQMNSRRMRFDAIISNIWREEMSKPMTDKDKKQARSEDKAFREQSTGGPGSKPMSTEEYDRKRIARQSSEAEKLHREHQQREHDVKNPPIMLAGLSADRESVFHHTKQSEVTAWAKKNVGENWEQTHRVKKQPGGEYHLLARVGKRMPKDQARADQMIDPGNKVITAGGAKWEMLRSAKPAAAKTPEPAKPKTAAKPKVVEPTAVSAMQKVEDVTSGVRVEYDGEKGILKYSLAADRNVFHPDGGLPRRLPRGTQVRILPNSEQSGRFAKGAEPIQPVAAKPAAVKPITATVKPVVAEQPRPAEPILNAYGLKAGTAYIVGRASQGFGAGAEYLQARADGGGNEWKFVPAKDMVGKKLVYVGTTADHHDKDAVIFDDPTNKVRLSVATIGGRLANGIEENPTRYYFPVSKYLEVGEWGFQKSQLVEPAAAKTPKPATAKPAKAITTTLGAAHGGVMFGAGGTVPEKHSQEPVLGKWDGQPIKLAGKTSKADVVTTKLANARVYGYAHIDGKKVNLEKSPMDEYWHEST